jgi:hypothetical protein
MYTLGSWRSRNLAPGRVDACMPSMIDPRPEDEKCAPLMHVAVHTDDAVLPQLPCPSASSRLSCRSPLTNAANSRARTGVSS